MPDPLHRPTAHEIDELFKVETDAPALVQLWYLSVWT
jgi:hypothetical protein